MLLISAARDGAMFVHASAGAPGDWNSVTSESAAAGCLRASRARVTFCGHVHVPGLYSADLRGMVSASLVKFGLPMALLRSRRWAGGGGGGGGQRGAAA